MTQTTTLSGGAGRSLIPGDYVMTADDFRRITEMLHTDSGIVMGESKVALVYSRLAKRLRALGLENFRSYCALVACADGVDERQRMLSALTTNLTRFFREPHHFDHLKAKVLPALLESAARGGRVRIWSAGCSNGAEPYSLALTILSMDPDAAERDIRILASDIDPQMVSLAREGVYGAEQAMAVPADLRDRWMESFKAEGERRWSMGTDARNLIAFRELNLLGPWPMQGRFDAIACRNVAIYFSETSQNELWKRFAGALNPGGWLYIGHSERVAGEAQARFKTEGVTTYALAGEPAR